MYKQLGLVLVWLPSEFEWVGGYIVLTLFLSLVPSPVWADDCGQLCDAKFWKSATPAAVTELLAAGVDVTARTEGGLTAFDLSEKNGKLSGTDAYWRLNNLRFE